MGGKTQPERVFGAACVRLTLERAGYEPTRVTLYMETLADLGVDDRLVLAYLASHRPEVESRLDEHRRSSDGG